MAAKVYPAGTVFKTNEIYEEMPIDSKGALIAPTPVASPATSLNVGTNKSGSITVGGTAKVLAALNASRRSLTIQNTSTGDLFINEHGTATADGNSFILEPKASANIQTRNAVSVLGMTTGQTWAATETSV